MAFQVIDKFSNDFFQSAFKLEKVKTDTIVFRLHYKLSVWFVVLYSICYMYVSLSTPISCMGSTSVEKSVEAFRKEINDYCWVHGTYIMMTSADPDLEIFPAGGTAGAHTSVKHHHYYKWMYFFIVFMIILLHTPRQFWKAVESGQMNSFVLKLNCDALTRNNEMERKKDELVEYLRCHMGHQRRYAMGFIFCEFLNVIVSSSLLYIWDYISEHEFSMHGTASLGYVMTPASIRTDPLAKIFPILGKCNFKTYGPSGGIQSHDFICVLPLNLVNERAAIFFWYYFALLVAVGITALMFRLVLIFSKRLRMDLLSSQAPVTAPQDIALLMEKCSYSDWFVIYGIGSCVEPILFREVIEKLAKRLHVSF